MTGVIWGYLSCWKRGQYFCVMVDKSLLFHTMEDRDPVFLDAIRMLIVHLVVVVIVVVLSLLNNVNDY